MPLQTSGSDQDAADKPRSVLFVTPRWARDGGISAHAEASATALVAHGLRVHVLAAEVQSHDPAGGVTVHCNPRLTDRDAPPTERIEAALEFTPDVVHLHQLDDPDVVAALRERAPVVISAHGYTACTSDLYYFRPGHQCTRAHGPLCAFNLIARGCAHSPDVRRLPGGYMRASRALEALRRADLTVSYSSAVDRHLAANRIAPRTVVPLFSTLAPAAAREERRSVLFAGRIVAPKGLGVLLRAARELDAEIVVCGDGWQLPAMRKLAARLGLRERVRFTGWLTAAQLAEELANASLVAMPSLWPEPFGLVGIEALAAGRPVVASATGGVHDWLDHGVNGLFVAPGDARALARALGELLDDPERRHTMGAAGRELVAARFSAARHVAALLDAYAAARRSWDPAALKLSSVLVR